MATLVVLPSKRKLDTQQYVIDFSNILYAGDSIASATVVVRLFTGYDPVPQAILFGAFTQTDTSITQKVTAGVPGVIYELVTTVTTTLGYIHVIVSRLAILPEDLGAIPNYSPFFLSSKPYPVYFIDGLDLAGIPQDGELKDPIIETSQLEQLNILSVPQGGELRDAFLDTNSREQLDIAALPQGGELRDILLETSSREQLGILAEPLDGLLRDALVSTASTERLNISAVPTGGSLYVP